MEIIQGKAIFGGIAIGPISFFAKEQKQVKRTKVEDTEAELHAMKQHWQQQLNSWEHCMRKPSKKWANLKHRFLKYIR